MLVVEPSALRYEAETALSAAEHDRGLMERVSTLEGNLVRITDRLEQFLNLLLRHSRTAYYDHVLLETLIDILSESKTIDRAKLNELWRKGCEQDAEKSSGTGRVIEPCENIITCYTGSERELFARTIKRGFALLEEGTEARGVRTLEQAAALAPDHALLNHFIGARFFRAGKWVLARAYLGRAFSAEPTDTRVCLLFGLTCGDEGDAAQAKDLLKRAVRRNGNSFAAHYALGRLHANEGDWKQALSEFKRALAVRPCPEGHYVVGLAYHHLNRQQMALRHLLDAVEMDHHYAEAFYLLGLVHLRRREQKRAAEAFDAAHALNLSEPRYRTARRRALNSGDIPTPPLFGRTNQGSKKLLTGGDARLAALLREDAVEAAGGTLTLRS